MICFIKKTLQLFLIILLSILVMGVDRGLFVSARPNMEMADVPSKQQLGSENIKEEIRVQSLKNNDLSEEEGVPTDTPRPTKTPSPIPPPQDLTRTNFMILFVILSVVVIIVGVWINRNGDNE